MREAVYLATSFFSFYFDERPAPAIVARREYTHQWWKLGSFGSVEGLARPSGRTGLSRNQPAVFPIAGPRLLNRFLVMTKLSAVQEAILQLDHEEQARLRIWLDEKALDLEEDSPELEPELLKAVQGPHSPLSKADLEAVAERALRANRSRRSA
ncbi:MAG: hypothetical protein FJ399_14585 [Verrucomicrobia bacterium]|nr:hypothetical protein [Verrucomicrobiota bacterium]